MRSLKKLDHREPMRLKNLPEPLRAFAWRNMACSHSDPFSDKGLPDDNPMIHPEVIFSDWNELNEGINSFVNAIKGEK